MESTSSPEAHQHRSQSASVVQVHNADEDGNAIQCDNISHVGTGTQDDKVVQNGDANLSEEVLHDDEAPHDNNVNQGDNANHQQDPPATFKPSLRFYLAFSSLTVLAMMVSLDGTSLSVALPVSFPSPHIKHLALLANNLRL